MKLILKSLEGLPEELAKLCAKEGEAHVFDLDAYTGPLKAALGREREAVQNLEQKVAAFKDIDPSKARDALSKVEKMKDWTPEDKLKEQIEAKTREIAAAKDAEIAKLKGSADLYRKGYEGLTLDREIEEALTEHKFLAPKLSARLFRDSVRMVEKDGRLVTEVVGGDGKPLTRMDTQGNLLKVSVKEFIADQAKRPEFAELIRGNQATGTQGGARPPVVNQPQHNVASPFVSEDDALTRLATKLAPTR